MAKVNRVLIIPYKPTNVHFEIRQEAGRLWNDCVKLHRYIRKRYMNNKSFWKIPSCNDFQKHFKGKYNLHSQTIQAIIQKFFANIETAFKNRKTGLSNAKLPWRYKKYYNPIFKGQSIKQMNNKIRLPIKDKKYLWFKVPFIDGKIVQAEISYNKLFLTIEKEIDVPKIDTSNIASIDFGIIHTAVITDGRDSLAIVGRGIRSIKQGHAKNLAKISRKISKTKKHSKRRKKLLKAKYKLIEKAENRLRNAFHQVSNTIVKFCVEKKIQTVVFGNLENINKNIKKKRRKQCNQEIGMMEFGTLFQYLKYKLEEIGVQIIKISEAYTSQTCPVCGQKHKPAGRVYKCSCGYKGIRDLVGAFNIRNLFINKTIVQGFSIPPSFLKYLRPIQLKRIKRSSLAMIPPKVA